MGRYRHEHEDSLMAALGAKAPHEWFQSGMVGLGRLEAIINSTYCESIHGSPLPGSAASATASRRNAPGETRALGHHRLRVEVVARSDEVFRLQAELADARRRAAKYLSYAPLGVRTRRLIQRVSATMQFGNSTLMLRYLQGCPPRL